jgi:hypothetical protein
MPFKSNIESHQVDLIQEPSFTHAAGQHGSTAVLCASPNAAQHRIQSITEQNNASTGSMVLTASPKAVQPSVQVPMLPQQRVHSTRYAADFFVPTGDRSTEEELYASIEDALTQPDEDDYDNSLTRQQELDGCELVPEVTADDVDSDLVCSSQVVVADIHTRTFPLQYVPATTAPPPASLDTLSAACRSSGSCEAAGPGVTPGWPLASPAPLSLLGCGACTPRVASHALCSMCCP